MIYDVATRCRYLTCFLGGGVTVMTPDVPFYDLNVSLSRLCCRPLMSWRGRCTVRVRKTRLSRQKWGSRSCPRWWRSSTTCRMASGTRSPRKPAFKMFLRCLKVTPVFFLVGQWDLGYTDGSIGREIWGQNSEPPNEPKEVLLRGAAGEGQLWVVLISQHSGLN